MSERWQGDGGWRLPPGISGVAASVFFDIPAPSAVRAEFRSQNPEFRRERCAQAGQPCWPVHYQLVPIIGSTPLEVPGTHALLPNYDVTGRDWRRQTKANEG